MTSDKRANKTKKDTWTKKKWYKIMSPEFLGSKHIADTFSMKEKYVIGRVIVLPLSELTGNFKDYKVKIKVRINNIRGNEAHTEYVGQEILRDQLLRIIRRWSSRIDSVDNVTMRDSSNYRIKSLTVTARRVNTSVKDEIRHSISDMINEYAGSKTIDEVVTDINSYKLQKTVGNKAKKIYPIRTVEVRMIEKL